MIVVIFLNGAAKSQKMVTLQHGDVVAEELVLTVPEARTNVLGVHVIRCKDSSALAKRFQRTAKLRELRRTTGSIPCPVVAQIAKMEIVCGVRSNVGRHPRHDIPGLLRAIGNGSGLPERIAGEEAADIRLTTRCSLQPVKSVTAAEVPLRTKVMVEAGNSKM